MDTFLSKVVLDFSKNTKDFRQRICILPSQRACKFFKNTFKKENPFCFLPKIKTIEAFISDFSGFQKVDSLTLLFDFYKIYKEKYSKNADDFGTFCGWAPTVLSDFNELDSYLIDSKIFFADLKNVERIKKMFKNETEFSKNKITENHRQFLSDLKFYYEKLTDLLYQKKQITQGMMYRICAEKIKKQENVFKKHLVFIGFNALNGAEAFIFETFLNLGIAKMYWDADFFYEKKQAGTFLQRYKNWQYYQKNSFFFEESNFEKPKNIVEIPVVKNIAQCKTAAYFIKKQWQEKKDFSNAAWVLCDESLLPLAVNFLPKMQKNITMGYPLKNMPFANFLEVLFELLKNRTQNKQEILVAYQDVLKVLHFDFLDEIFDKRLFKKFLQEKKYVQISQENFQEFFKKNKAYDFWVALFFCEKPKDFLEKIKLFFEKFKTRFADYFFKFQEIFEKLWALEKAYGFFENFNILQQVYLQILSQEKLFFQGEATQGLQIMGLLETRCLDFETLWITSLNEGFLPKNKNINSFIPFDLRKNYGLPTYEEKDAIFAYHFYRLLQRAKNIYLMYDSQTDGYGAGEKSRFLSQLQWISKHTLEQKKVATNTEITDKKPIKMLQENILQDLKKEQKIVFSASKIKTYINNPLNYYQKYILKIKEQDLIETTIQPDKMGNIIHKTLEKIYTPFIGKILQENNILKMQKTFENVLENEYENENIPMKEGKNLLIKEVSKDFIKRFLKQEKQRIQNHKIQILALEKKLEIPFKIQDFDNIFLTGNIDRIEKVNGKVRIIDYKTGKVAQNDLKKGYENLENITEHYDYNHAFQLFFYAKLYENSFEKEIETGIYSFRNLNAGFLKIDIDKKDIAHFEKYLQYIIQKILTEDFIENTNAQF